MLLQLLRRWLVLVASLALSLILPPLLGFLVLLSFVPTTTAATMLSAACCGCCPAVGRRRDHRDVAQQQQPTRPDPVEAQCQRQLRGTVVEVWPKVLATTRLLLLLSARPA